MKATILTSQRGSLVEIVDEHGRAFYDAKRAEPFDDDGHPAVAFDIDGQPGVEIHVGISTRDGVALVGLSTERLGDGDGDGIECRVRDGVIVPVHCTAPATQAEREYLALFGPQAWAFDDVGAFVEEIEYLRAMPVDPSRAITSAEDLR